jgi:hypothetical protein
MLMLWLARTTEYQLEASLKVGLSRKFEDKIWNSPLADDLKTFPLKLHVWWISQPCLPEVVFSCFLRWFLNYVQDTGRHAKPAISSAKTKETTGFFDAEPISLRLDVLAAPGCTSPRSRWMSCRDWPGRGLMHRRSQAQRAQACSIVPQTIEETMPETGHFLLLINVCDSACGKCNSPEVCQLHTLGATN